MKNRGKRWSQHFWRRFPLCRVWGRQWMQFMSYFNLPHLRYGHVASSDAATSLSSTSPCIRKRYALYFRTCRQKLTNVVDISCCCFATRGHTQADFSHNRDQLGSQYRLLAIHKIGHAYSLLKTNRVWCSYSHTFITKTLTHIGPRSSKKNQGTNLCCKKRESRREYVAKHLNH
jgi:hypothetical protein